MGKAKRSITAAGLFRPRSKFWITLPMIEHMIVWGRANQSFNKHIALFAISYIFLLRLPSEALPMIIGPDNSGGAQSILVCQDDISNAGKTDHLAALFQGHVGVPSQR